MTDYKQIYAKAAEITYAIPAGFLVSYQIESNNKSSYLSVHTMGIGMEGKKEIRRPGLLNATVVHAQFEFMGYKLQSISTKEELASFLRTGGHAFAAEGLLDSHWKELLDAKLVARITKGDFNTYSLVEKHHLRRFAVGKDRMQILDRDNYQCLVCGASPDDSVHIRLDVHHIKPWNEGGITMPENLITLCETCHLGIRVADRQRLYEKVGLRIDRQRSSIYPENPKWSRDQFISYSSLLSNSVAFEIHLRPSNKQPSKGKAS